MKKPVTQFHLSDYPVGRIGTLKTGMNWDEIKDIFKQATDLQPNQREEYLDSQRLGDDERQEIESLLKAARDVPDFMDRTAFDLVSESGHSYRDLLRL